MTENEQMDAHRLLTTEEAAALLNVPVRTLTNWRCRGRFPGPPFVRLGGTVRYRRGDLLEWVAERVQTQAS